jgi:NAD(P)-dependent dehydrogenase (short-subunit alcohol dehydrogenase family)
MDTDSMAGLAAVITGGASGIGLALAEALVQRGARVAIADLDIEQARAAARALGTSAHAYACDVTDRHQIEALAAAVRRDLGEVNYVFANAGVAVPGKITDTDPREFQWIFDVNVTGTFSTVQVFAPLLVETAARDRPARLIVTGSENSVGLPAGSPSSAYTASKHALLGFADALRRDLDGTGVGVSIVCPGLVATRIWDARKHRQDRYGGQAEMPPEIAQRASHAIAAHGQAPARTAQIALDGIARGEFMIITDPKIRTLAAQRGAVIDAALSRIDNAH